MKYDSEKTNGLVNQGLRELTEKFYRNESKKENQENPCKNPIILSFVYIHQKSFFAVALCLPRPVRCRIRSYLYNRTHEADGRLSPCFWHLVNQSYQAPIPRVQQ